MEHSPLATGQVAFSIDETAELLRCSRSHIYHLINNGIIRRVRIGHRSIITAKEIDRLLSEGTPPVAS